MRGRKRQRGFTLVEMLVVVAIVAILASIAYPFYEEAMYRTRRADGKTSLEEIRLNQEKWRASHTAYTTTLGSGGLEMSSTSHDGYYDLSISAATATTYSAIATPAGIQSGDSCGTLTVDEEGPSGSTAHLKKCWNR